MASGSLDVMNLTYDQALVLQEEAAKTAAVRDDLQSRLSQREATCSELSQKIEVARYEVQKAEKQLAERQQRQDEQDYAAASGSSGDFEASSNADAFQDSEIILQIMGFNPGEGCSASKVFFVVQFYHFPAMRTSNARLVAAVRSAPGSTADVTHVLVKDVAEADLGTPDADPGMTVSFFVNGEFDPTHLGAFLSSGHVHIEAWDAESLLQLGAARLPMAGLLRHGQERAELITSASIACIPSLCGGSEAGAPGTLQLRMTNLGRVDVESILEEEMHRSENKAMAGQPVDVFVTGRLAAVGPRPPGKGRKLLQRVQPVADVTKSALQGQGLSDMTMKMWKLRCSEFQRRGGSSIPPRPASPLTAPKRIAESRRAAELVQIDTVRKHSRPGTLVKWLETELTRRLRISPTFATAEYFELVVENSAAEPRSFKIRMPEAEAGVLSLVLDQSEQAAFRVADPFLLSQSTGRVDPATRTLDLGPGEKVVLSFKYQSERYARPAATGAVRNSDRAGGDFSDQPLPAGVGGSLESSAMGTPVEAERTVTIEVVETGDSKQLAARLQVEICPRPFVIDSRMHIYGQQNGFSTHRLPAEPHMLPRWRRRRSPAGAQRAVWAVACTQPDVEASIVQRTEPSASGATVDVLLRGRSGPSTSASRTFLVVLYCDQYRSVPVGIWQVVQHALEGHTVTCTTGQDIYTTLSGRLPGGLPSDATLRCLSYCPTDATAVECQPAAATVSADGGFDVQCILHSPRVGRRSWVVTACDVMGRDHQLVHRWLLTVVAAAPAITNRYEALGLPTDRQKRLKIRVLNPDVAHRKILSVTSDQPKVLWPLNDRLAIPAAGSCFLDLVFEPQPDGTMTDVLLFLNTSAPDVRTEICICVRAVYMPPPIGSGLAPQ